MPGTVPELVVVLCAALLVVLFLDRGPSRPRLSPYRASWVLTPGVANPDVSQDNIGRTICARGWTETVRPPTSYTDQLKVEQMKQYGRSGTSADYQEDHLISLEVGGDPTDPRNLWPEPIERATDVDSIENQLNQEICSGQISLAEGQRRESELKHTAG